MKRQLKHEHIVFLVDYLSPVQRMVHQARMHLLGAMDLVDATSGWRQYKSLLKTEKLLEQVIEDLQAMKSADADVADDVAAWLRSNGNIQRPK